jgi:hypothetical protein
MLLVSNKAILLSNKSIGKGSFLQRSPESRNRPTERERAEGREAVRAERGRNPRSTSEAAAVCEADGESPTRPRGGRMLLHGLRLSRLGRGTPNGSYEACATGVRGTWGGFPMLPVSKPAQCRGEH